MKIKPDFFIEKRYKRKTILLADHEIAKRIFFIQSGAIRVWFNNEGIELTVDFFIENNLVSSFDSFFQGIPSIFNIETIEDTVVFELSKNDFLDIVADKEVASYINETVYKRFGTLINRLLTFIKDSPQQRYENMMKERPELIQRFPQHYIASYLGITDVSLSRIRNRKR